VSACRRIRIRGRVQGVFFRHHTKQEADRLGITGWVKNLPDGSVEALICGGEKQLERMESWLAEGPPAATVEEIESSTQQPDTTFSHFEVRY
jgi:acylphosphatase